MDLALIFGGVVVSMLVEWIKTRTGTTKLGTMTFVVILALVGGLGFQLLTHFGMWESAVQLFVSAGAFYAFIIKNITD